MNTNIENIAAVLRANGIGSDNLSDLVSFARRVSARDSAMKRNGEVIAPLPFPIGTANLYLSLGGIKVSLINLPRKIIYTYAQAAEKMGAQVRVCYLSSYTSNGIEIPIFHKTDSGRECEIVWTDSRGIKIPAVESFEAEQFRRQDCVGKSVEDIKDVLRAFGLVIPFEAPTKEKDMGTVVSWETYRLRPGKSWPKNTPAQEKKNTKNHWWLPLLAEGEYVETLDGMSVYRSFSQTSALKFWLECQDRGFKSEITRYAIMDEHTKYRVSWVEAK